MSFRDKRTRQFADGKYIKAFSGFARQAEWPDRSPGPLNVEIVDYH